MPRLLEYDIAAQTQLRVVVPDDMSDEDVEKLVKKKALDMLDSCLPVIQVLGPATKLSIKEASAEDADRVSDNRKRITDEEVSWLGEGD